MKKLFFLLLAGTMITGCGVTHHLTQNQNVTQTEIVLASNNYRIVKTVAGKAQATYVLGIGGLSLRALKDNAYADMVKNAKLHGSQAIINVITSVKQQLILLGAHREITTTGTVIEFLPPERTPEAASEQTPATHIATTPAIAQEEPHLDSEVAIQYVTIDRLPLPIDSELITTNSYHHNGCLILYDAIIPDRLFHHQMTLQEITLDNVTKIGNAAFESCQLLTRITLSTKTASIGLGAFDACPRLNVIYCPALTPPTLHRDAFEWADLKELQIYVPKSAVGQYTTSKGWKKYAEKIVGYDFQ